MNNSKKEIKYIKDINTFRFELSCANAKKVPNRFM